MLSVFYCFHNDVLLVERRFVGFTRIYISFQPSLWKGDLSLSSVRASNARTAETTRDRVADNIVHLLACMLMDTPALSHLASPHSPN